MKATITSIELKGPFKFFALSRVALDITRQLKKSNYKAYKKTGLWTKHYTMTLWENERDLKDFASRGAHLEAMKRTAKIAREIRTITIETDSLPNWKKAKELLDNAKIIQF